MCTYNHLSKEDTVGNKISPVPPFMVRTGNRFNKEMNTLISNSDRENKEDKHSESMVSIRVRLESILDWAGRSFL